MAGIILEGTWEEVAQHADELAGKRVRVVVLGSPPPVDPDHFYFRATPEEWREALDRHAEEFRDLPGLPPEAFDRETLYDERC